MRNYLRLYAYLDFDSIGNAVVQMTAAEGLRSVRLFHRGGHRAIALRHNIPISARRVARAWAATHGPSLRRAS